MNKKLVKRVIYHIYTSTGALIPVQDFQSLLGVDFGKLGNYFVHIYPIVDIQTPSSAILGDSVSIYVGTALSDVTAFTMRQQFKFNETTHYPLMFPLSKDAFCLNADFDNWQVAETHYAVLVVEIYQISTYDNVEMIQKTN